MKKNQKIILGGAIVVFLGLCALIIVLIVQNSRKTREVNDISLMEARMDSIQAENDRLELARLSIEFDQLNAEFDQYEGKEIHLKNDSLVKQYNEAKARVTSLLSQLEKEKNANKANREKIKQLEAEITTLKGIAKHYLEEIQRLNEENQGLRQELTTEKERNQTLERENTSARQSNEALTQTVKLAKKLNITGLSLSAYNAKGKSEKNITKAKKLGVSFRVAPNNTTSPGNKTFYIRILSPEGNLLGGGTSISYDGSSIAGTASRSYEYDNNELPVDVYWNVDATLTPGDYTVEVFCDGYRLGSSRFNMKK